MLNFLCFVARLRRLLLEEGPIKQWWQPLGEVRGPRCRGGSGIGGIDDAKDVKCGPEQRDQTLLPPAPKFGDRSLPRTADDASFSTSVKHGCCDSSSQAFHKKNQCRRLFHFYLRFLNMGPNNKKFGLNVFKRCIIFAKYDKRWNPLFRNLKKVIFCVLWVECLCWLLLFLCTLSGEIEYLNCSTGTWSYLLTEWLRYLLTKCNSMMYLLTGTVLANRTYGV